MKTMVNLIVPDYRIAPSSHLDSRQSIAINVIVFDQTATFTKYVYAALMTVVYLVFPA